ncbi:MAG: universal stress protein [Chloroflexi bacterium]|nr:universal stress protein [Chloroflexota bacterium]
MNAKRILLPVNGKPYSELTFRWACQMARESKTELHAVYVIEVPLELSLESEIADDINKGEEILARIEAIASEEKYKDLQARFLRARQAGPAIVLESEDRFMDLLIVGVPYLRRFGSCTLGATASYIFHNASCQVMFWRERAPAPIFPRV